ncbi:cytochrome b5 isoform X2 [Megachile rotundata]
MDLLSPAFRSLKLRDSAPQDRFLDLDQRNTINLDETVTESRRKSWQNKEDSQRANREEQKLLRTINLDEVAWHDTHDNCWIVVHDFVYDCTEFLKNHPGGSDVILEYAGRDATLAFIGTGHSSVAKQSLERYLIGELPPEERIFRVPNGVKISGF